VDVVCGVDLCACKVGDVETVVGFSNGNFTRGGSGYVDTSPQLLPIIAHLAQLSRKHMVFSCNDLTKNL